MPSFPDTHEQPGETLSWPVGEQLRIRYPGLGAKPITYVIGRNPDTSETRTLDQKTADEVEVQLTEAGSTVGTSVSRRALKLTLYPDHMTINNPGRNDLRWWRPELKGEAVVNPDQTLPVQYNKDFRGARITLGYKDGDHPHGE